MMLIKHFVRLTVKENSPVPWDALLNVTLRSNAGRTVTCNRVVPARMLVHSVEGAYVFAKSFARFVCGLECPVKINIFPSIVAAETNAIALIGYDIDERVSTIKPLHGRITL